MAQVKQIQKYVLNGVEFPSLEAIKEDLHNTIGLEVLDKINRTCPLAKHRDYEKLLRLLCSKEVREVLVRCLTVEFEVEDGYMTTGTLNVLDV